MWPVPEVTIRLPTPPHPSPRAGFPQPEPRAALTDYHKEERTCPAHRPTGLKEREPRGAEPHKVSYSPPAGNQKRSHPFLWEGAGRKAGSFLPFQYFQRDRCFYFMGLKRDACTRKKIILLALYWHILSDCTLRYVEERV